MIFLGYTSGMKGFKIMRKPNNVIFHGVTAMFDEYMFPSCLDHISTGSTRIGDNYPSTEFNIPLEDGGWFDGGALPPFGPYPSAGGIPPQQGPPILGPQQPLAGPPNPLVVPQQPPAGPSSPLVVPPRPPQGMGRASHLIVPAGAPQPSTQPPAPSRRPMERDNDAIAHLFREMLVHGTSPENQRRWGVDPSTGRATDTPGLFQNPPPVVAPPTFPGNINEQGLRGFTIPPGCGPAWEQQLHDTLRARYQRPQPAQQAGPPPALEEQVLSESSEPRRSSRVLQPASMTCMDQWILLPVSEWTYDVVWQIYQPRILLELSERKLR